MSLSCWLLPGSVNICSVGLSSSFPHFIQPRSSNSSHFLATLFFLPLTSHRPFHQPYLGLTFCLLFLLAPGVSPRSLHCAAFPQPLCCCHSCMPPLLKSKSQAFFNYSLTYLQASIPFHLCTGLMCLMAPEFLTTYILPMPSNSEFLCSFSSYSFAPCHYPQCTSFLKN